MADCIITLACESACIHVIQRTLTHLQYNLIPHELLASRQAAYVWAYLLCSWNAYLLMRHRSILNVNGRNRTQRNTRCANGTLTCS